MRCVVFIFGFIYLFQIHCLKFLLKLTALGPLDKLNIVIQMKKKLRSFIKARGYFEKLTEPFKTTFNQEKEGKYAASYVDFHFYQMALYFKFSS